MPEDNIVDASKPSAGRMYDYYLGGNHNFEVDRQAADQVLKNRAVYDQVLFACNAGRCKTSPSN